MADDAPLTASERRELEALRARERERHAEVERAMAAAARAQERAYWLDRWHVDLNAWVATPAGTALRFVLRALRSPVRLARRMRK